MAIDFDGTDDALKTTTNVIRDSDFSPTSYTFTISCWVKPDAAQNASIWAQQQDDGGTQGRLVLEILSANRKFRFRYQNSSITTGSYAYGTDYDTWYHLVTTHQYTGASGRHLYIDGAISVSETSTNRSSDHEDNDLDFLIGAGLATSSPYGHTNHFNGQIAELAVWKVILTAGEVTSLYNGASPLFVRPNKILSYYPLGGPYVTSSTGTTDAYRDIVGGNNLTETSSPAFAATPRSFGTGTGMFYPNTYMGNDTIPFTSAATDEEETTDETAITGDDVIHEIVTDNRRTQAGITVHSGGINFKKRDNTDSIDAQVQVDELNDRFVKSKRQNQNVHG